MQYNNDRMLTAGFELLPLLDHSNRTLSEAAYALALIDMGEEPKPRPKKALSIHKSIAILTVFPFKVLAAMIVVGLRGLRNRTIKMWQSRLRRER